MDGALQFSRVRRVTYSGTSFSRISNQPGSRRLTGTPPPPPPGTSLRTPRTTIRTTSAATRTSRGRTRRSRSARRPTTWSPDRRRAGTGAAGLGRQTGGHHHSRRRRRPPRPKDLGRPSTTCRRPRRRPSRTPAARAPPPGRGGVSRAPGGDR